MTIDQSADSVPLPREFFGLKPSHRSWPEQLVGLGLYLVLSFGMDFLHRWLITFSLKSDWFHRMHLAPWATHHWPSSSFGSISFVFLSISMWCLWRRYSLKRLKLELSLFLIINAMMGLWSLSFFAVHESLLGLIALLLAGCAILLTAVLFWKKERLASGLLTIPFFWTFYLASLTMAICTIGAP